MLNEGMLLLMYARDVNRRSIMHKLLVLNSVTGENAGIALGRDYLSQRTVADRSDRGRLERSRCMSMRFSRALTAPARSCGAPPILPAVVQGDLQLR